MLKKSIALFLLVAIFGGIFVACDSKNDGITSDEAVSIALKDMGISEDDVESIHVHEGMHDGKLCYNVYITADGESLTYVINRVTGDIFTIQEGSGHTH